MPLSAVIYARSSSDYPLSAEEQAANLRTVAADHGWMVAKVFIDRPTMSKRGSRPATQPNGAGRSYPFRFGGKGAAVQH